jgi:hypothetical protein
VGGIVVAIVVGRSSLLVSVVGTVHIGIAGSSMIVAGFEMRLELEVGAGGSLLRDLGGRRPHCVMLLGCVEQMGR